MTSAEPARALRRRLGWRRVDIACALAVGLFGHLALTALGFALPPGFSGALGPLLAAGMAVALVLTGRSRLLWAASGAAAALLLIAAYTPLVRWSAAGWVRSDAAATTGAVDAVVVLSARLTDDAELSSVGLDRLVSGVGVALEAGVRELVVSRLEIEVGDTVVTSDADQARTARLASGAIDLHVVGPVASTRDEAVAVAGLAQRTGWRRIAVVTSPSHTRRACATFERVGFVVRCVAARSGSVAWGRLDGPFDRLRAAAALLYERAALRWYRSQGWV